MASEDGQRNRERLAFYLDLIGSYGAFDSQRRPIPDSGLLGYAGQQIVLSAIQDDGCALRVHLESMQRQSGKPEPLLQAVEHDESVEYIWEYFCSMNARRTSNGFGPNPITEEGVEAWARRRGIRLEPWENRLLDALESLFMSLQAKVKK